jgi:hypothetical protein
MPSHRERYLGALVNGWLDAIKHVTKHETRLVYRRLVLEATHQLEAKGMNSTPSKIGEEEIYFLWEEAYAHLQPRVNRTQMSIFGTYLRQYDNNIVERLHLPWPQGHRMRVKWLAPQQCVTMLDAT